MHKLPLYLIVIFFITSCTSSLTDPQKIIDQSIEAHGGNKFTHCTMEFDFRDKHYIAKRNNGNFSYERIFKDSTNTIHDYLTNKGFTRQINGEIFNVTDSMAEKYTRSVNSVIYFASLPYGLNDLAVRKKFLGETKFDNQPYYKIEITFAQEGGGEDFDDVFHYWIHKHKFTVDYFSYSYHTDDGGIRFRKAIKQHKVNGLVLQDYINYKPKDKSIKMDDLEDLYKQNELVELSKIELKNITIK